MQNILVTEDEDSLRNLITIILRQEGYVVWEARNGKEASQLLGQFVPDLLITDLVMPEKEGMELIREVRTLHPKMPIIAISGAQAAQPGSYLKMAKSLGANYELAKPFTPGELLGLVIEALGE